MKELDFKTMEIITGGDDLDDFIGGLVCGAALTGAILAMIGCANFIRKNW